ncbi:MAG: Gfo/Idh/MocA family oxidoreductase [Gammaproteobacteria bacterium]|nr:Gfo/Idh/MocA family oxidoreductase [Gammaproteobacteria bacterium]
MNKIRTGVIGVGYLGKFHAEKFDMLPNSELVAVCDIHEDRCKEIARRHNVEPIFDYTKLINKIDAVSIAVPTSLHYPIAKFFLENGIHVLLEKPIASTVVEAQSLIDIANQKKVVFQIGHLERFNSVLVALDTVIDNPRFIESIRLAPFKPRGTDINVVLDLMIHDIDIIQRIVGSPIINIHANGASVLSSHIDIANVRLQFENGCVANVTASRVSFKVERKLRIFQHDAFISLDLHNKKLAIHRKGISEMFPGIPEIISEEQAYEQGDALLDEISAFLHSIRTNTQPVVTGEDGKRALATAVEITRIVSDQLTADEAAGFVAQSLILND